MKIHLIISIFVLISLTHCDSVMSPGVEPSPDTTGKDLTSPELQQPEDNARDQNLSPTLTWKKVSGATTYEVQLSESDTFSDTLANQETDTSAYQINGLSPETTYYWKVRAIGDNSENGPWSGTRNFTTSAKTEDTEPVSTTLQSPNNGAGGQPLGAELTWSEVVNAKAYRVQYATNSDFSTVESDTTTRSTSYKISGASYNHTYYWRVRPQLDSTETRWSEAWKFTTKSEPEPVTTTLSAPSNGATGQTTSPTLAWQEVSGAKSYRVQVDTDESFSGPDEDQSIQATSLSLSNLNNETTYYWRVRPEAGSGTGEWSEVWNFKTEVSSNGNNNGNDSATSDMWVSAYLASYNHYAPPGGNWGNLPTDEIDWDAFTHLFYFSLKAKTDGSLSTIAAYQNMNPDRINAVVNEAHKRDKPVIITIGGWGNHQGFSQAISPGVRSVFISNLVALIKTWGFDGIDLDMEPINDSDVANYKAFVKQLRAALDQLATPLGDKPLLTAATANQPEMFADLQNYFDQINLMTYDYSGAWQGWVTWHNSALYDGGLTFPNSSKSLPSIDSSIKRFVNAGVSKSKLGIGIDFYGYVWNGGSGTSTGGVSEPNQSWSTAPTVTDNVPYHEIMNKYYQDSVYRWDDGAKAPYLRIDQGDDSSDKFISYDDERAIKEKINYIRQQQLGGAILWELTGGYQKDKPAGSRDRLLQTVKNAVW